MDALIEWAVRKQGGEILPCVNEEAARAITRYVLRDTVVVHRVVTYGDWGTGQPDTCRQGHPKTEETTFYTSDGRRNCRPCRQMASRKSKAKKRAEQAARATRPKQVRANLTPEQASAALDAYLAREGIA